MGREKEKMQARQKMWDAMKDRFYVMWPAGLMLYYMVLLVDVLKW